jgi:outer membrane protein OmpU
MRKVLLATAALAAMGAASAQAAEPIKLTIGGVVQEMFGYIDNRGLNTDASPATTKTSKTEQNSNVLIRFTGGTKLDNGLNVSLYVDYLMNDASSSRNGNATCNRTPWGPFQTVNTAPTCNNNTGALRSYGTVAGGFGSIVAGEREDISYIIHNSAPDVSTIGPVGDGFWYNIANVPSFHHIYQVDNTSRFNGHTSKITYISPSLFGASVGFSYIPSTSFSQNSSSPADASSSDAAVYSPFSRANGLNLGGDAYAGGLAYNNKLGPVAVKADFSVIQNSFANLRQFNGGTNIGFGGFTVGGSFLNREVPSDASVRVGGVAYTTAAQIAALSPAAGAGSFATARITPAAFAQSVAFAGNNYTVGGKYELGPYAVSFAYFHDNTKALSVFNGTGRADRSEIYNIGAAYTAGPGVTFNMGVGYFNYKGDNLNNQTPWNNNNDGYFAMTGMTLVF